MTIIIVNNSFSNIFENLMPLRRSKYSLGRYLILKMYIWLHKVMIHFLQSVSYKVLLKHARELLCVCHVKNNKMFIFITIRRDFWVKH